MCSAIYVDSCAQAANTYVKETCWAYKHLQSEELCAKIGDCYENFKKECHIPEDYAIKLKKLGEGSFGDVFLTASEESLDSYVIKIINPIAKKLPSPYDFKEFEEYSSEFSILTKLTRMNCPLFPPLVAAGRRPPCECPEQQHYPYEILGIIKRADGYTIEQHVIAGHLLDSIETITSFTRQLIEAQVFLIDNLEIFHADLNPTNIFWEEHKKKLTVIDFGRMVSRGSDAQTLNDLCALAIRPPEVYSDQEGLPLDQEGLPIEQSLIFFIASVLYFFSTGDRLIDFKKIPNVNASTMEAYFQKKLQGKISRNHKWVKDVLLWGTVINTRLSQLGIPFDEKKLCLDFMGQLLNYDPGKRFVSHHIALQHSFLNTPVQLEKSDEDSTQTRRPNKKPRR